MCTNWIIEVPRMESMSHSLATNRHDNKPCRNLHSTTTTSLPLLIARMEWQITAMVLYILLLTSVNAQALQSVAGTHRSQCSMDSGPRVKDMEYRVNGSYRQNHEVGNHLPIPQPLTSRLNARDRCAKVESHSTASGSVQSNQLAQTSDSDPEQEQNESTGTIWTCEWWDLFH